MNVSAVVDECTICSDRIDCPLFYFVSDYVNSQESARTLLLPADNAFPPILEVIHGLHSLHEHR